MTTTYRTMDVKSELPPRTTKEQYRSIWQDLAGVAFSQEWVKAGDINTRVLHAGTKGNPALIMIGGTGGHAEAFSAVLGPLSQNFDCYAIDFLGHGRTDKPDYDYDTKAGNKFLLDLLDALGLEKSSFAGTSLGSWYSISFAYHHPDRVEKLIMSGPSGGPGNLNPPGRAGGSGPYTHREGNDRQAAADNPTWENAERIVKSLLGDQIADDMIAARLDASRQIGLKMKHILWTMDPARRRENCLTAEQVQTVKVPVLLIGMGNESGIELAENFPSSILVRWTGAGGWPNWTDPKKWSEVVTSFMKGTL